MVRKLSLNHRPKQKACVELSFDGEKMTGVATSELTPPTYLAVLLELEQLRESAVRLESLVVRLVREAGVTWEEIGDELGISRQAARSRFMTPRRRQRGSALPPTPN